MRLKSLAIQWGISKRIARARTNQSELVIFSSHLIVPDNDDANVDNDANSIVLRCADESTMCWNNIVVIGSKTYGDSVPHRSEPNDMDYSTKARTKSRYINESEPPPEKKREKEKNIYDERIAFAAKRSIHLNKIQWFGRQQRRWWPNYLHRNVNGAPNWIGMRIEFNIYSEII